MITKFKIFEVKKFENEEERGLYNFSQRLERAINKFFGATKNGHWYKSSIPKRENEHLLPAYNYVNYTYYKYSENHKTLNLSLYTYNIDENKIKAFKKKLNNLGVDYFINYELSIEQAEELLNSLKNGELEKMALEYDMNKYNI